MTTTSGRTNTPATQYKVVGTRPIRHDGADKVTGRARYGLDFNVVGLLHGKILRSPHVHARIKSIDTSAAEKLPGVKAVVTARDFPANPKGQPIDFAEAGADVRVLAENIMAGRVVLYQGHAVAAVAATNEHIAEEALGLIKVEYEVLPALLDVRESMKPDAPLIHEKLTTFFTKDRQGRGENTGVKSNIATHLQFKRGDLATGFKEAHVVVEREFTTSMVHQGYIEPYVSTGQWGKDGRITVWTSTQNPFGIRASTAAILGVPESTVKVVSMEIGGGFGGKQPAYLDPVAAMLSKKSGRPVKIVMTRKEVFDSTGPASGSYLRCKIGATKDGRITAAELYLAYEAGAFPGSPIAGGAMSSFGPYKVENMMVEGYDVVVNKPKVQAYRAPGQPQTNFAVESVVDELAQKLGIDPLEFRIKNATDEGDLMPSGMVFPPMGLKQLEEAMKNHDHYKTPLTGPNRGRGIAVGYRFNGGGVSSATINVNDDGTVALVTGSVDIGGTRTSVAMQAAEVLGLRAEDVTPTVVDTDSIGWTGTTAGSRVTFDTGLAAITTAEEVKRLMIARAAKIWEVPPAEVAFKDGVFTSLKNPNDKLTFKQLAARLRATGGPVTASAINGSTGVGPIFAGNIIDVEVDPETGKVQILRCTAFMDAGKAVHPSYVEGQLQGGTAQGIGWALNEEYFLTKEGGMANSTFLDYRMPTALDLPLIDTVLIEVPNPRHPFGLRGVGEVPIVPPPAALANAIARATGARLTKLPMKPGTIWEAVEAHKAATKTKK
ncbi:MAG: xanthine dehydrogenase family protein molybdopterin-binding subunit [Dehalococcoidia bacterium]|nr:xanthine dehydrogenase family protein molybdopterin-binding subunit [Dehalococcoidia bacterium]